MPVVAHTAGIQNEGIFNIHRIKRSLVCDGNEPGFAIFMKKDTIRYSMLPGIPVNLDRPLHRFKPVILFIIQIGQCRNIKITLSLVFKTGQGRMFPKDVCGGVVGKGFFEPHTLRHLRNYPPVRFGFTGCIQKFSLPRNTPFRIGHSAIFLTPGERWQQDICISVGIRMPDAI